MRLSNTLPDCSKAHALASHTHLQPDRFVAQCPKVVSSVSSSPSHLCDTQHLKDRQRVERPSRTPCVRRSKKRKSAQGKGAAGGLLDIGELERQQGTGN